MFVMVNITFNEWYAYWHSIFVFDVFIAKKFCQINSSLSIRELKNDHDVSAYAIKHTGFASSTWVPIDQKNQPRYDG